ncbi:MAG: HAD family hydrolase [Candidatus Dormibacteria bacterium]
MAPATRHGRSTHRPAPLLTGLPIAAVLFDYGLTLVSFEPPGEALEAAQEAIARCVEAAGHPRPPLAMLREAVHDRVEAQVSAHEASGALREIDVAALERRAFSDIGLDLDEELRDRCSVLAQEAWWHGVTLYPEAIGVLRGLRRAGLRVGVCSNAAWRSASMHDQLREVGLASVIDAAVFSGEVGWRKPSRRLFAAALRALGARPEQTVFVGDRMREDIVGAARAGMRTVLVARDPAHPGEPRPGGPDAVITTLSDLPALLRGGPDVTKVGAQN